jgi:acyl carrier protein
MDRTGAIKRFIVGEYLSDTTVIELSDDYDLIRNGVISSLGLPRLIAWLQDQFEIPVNDVDLTPTDFRSVRAIAEFVARAQEIGRDHSKID